MGILATTFALAVVVYFWVYMPIRRYLRGDRIFW